MTSSCSHGGTITMGRHLELGKKGREGEGEREESVPLMLATTKSYNNQL